MSQPNKRNRDEFSGTEPKVGPPLPETLSDDQIGRLAALIAAGKEQVPAGLSGDQVQDLTERVRRLRHGRLLSLIARQVAAAIWTELATDDDDI